MVLNTYFKWKSKRFEYYFRFFILTWLIFAFLFLIFDLQISTILVDYDSEWAKLITNYGEIPGRIVIVLGLIVQIYRIYTSSNWKTNVSFWGILIINTTVLFSVFSPFCPSSTNHVFNLSILLISALTPFIVVYLLKNKNFILNDRFIRFSRVTFILAAINPFLLVQSLKLAWGRVRFRDLNSSYSNFTPWIIPQGFNGNKSFPSGHTAMGWMVLPLLLLVSNGKNKYLKMVKFSLISWGFLVAIGRVVIGAHYASDVLFSTGFAIIIYLILINRELKDQINS